MEALLGTRFRGRDFNCTPLVAASRNTLAIDADGNVITWVGGRATRDAPGRCSAGQIACLICHYGIAVRHAHIDANARLLTACCGRAGMREARWAAAIVSRTAGRPGCPAWKACALSRRPSAGAHRQGQFVDNPRVSTHVAVCMPLCHCVRCRQASVCLGVVRVLLCGDIAHTVPRACCSPCAAVHPPAGGMCWRWTTRVSAGPGAATSTTSACPATASATSCPPCAACRACGCARWRRAACTRWRSQRRGR